jgi:hypothetical protein
MLNRRMQYDEEVGFLSKIVYEIRQDHPTLSLRAIYYKIKPSGIGRDKFENLCAIWGYSIERKVSSRRTTNSNGVIRFDNLLSTEVLDDIDQAYCSDITYFEVEGMFFYITFILDCYSRRILGHSVSNRLVTEATTIPAIKIAIKTRGGKLRSGAIFHSDGGGQYFDKNFLVITKTQSLRNSMCEYPWDNGKAERINGIIKNNYLMHWNIRSFDALLKNVDREVKLYNEERPHKSLNYLTPVEFEKKQLNLIQQTKPMMTESFDSINKSNGGIEPLRLEQTKPQNRDVFSAINSVD